MAGLQTAGLVTREADPADGRAARVLITEDGRRTLHSLAQREAEALTALLSTVDEEDLRIEVRGDREPEADVHTGGVPFHRCVDEVANAGELDDLRELRDDFRAAHAQNRAVEEGVLPAGQLRMKPGSHLDER